VALHLSAKPGGESDAFNLVPELDRTRCPTLVIGGDDDPMKATDLAAALPPSLVQFERFADCGHGVVPDAPDRAIALLRELILKR
jgi:proline iminopeptidase